MNNTDDLARYQDAFIATAFRGERAAPSVEAVSIQAGFSVYRNTLLKSCVDNLAANFPTVMRLVGEQWFRAAALEYACGEPPVSVSLFDYGATFPVFLSKFPPAAELPYLADVARLDLLWIACHIAADAPALFAAELALLPPEALGTTCLCLHPASRWQRCEGHPAGEIWITNREERAFDAERPWRGDNVLLTRIDNAVQWCLVKEGAAALLDACANGASLQDAATHALTVQPDLDIAGTLALLLQTGAFTTLPEKA